MRYSENITQEKQGWVGNQIEISNCDRTANNARDLYQALGFF